MSEHGRVFRSVRLPELEAVANELVKYTDRIAVWLFYGEMGAGKTTLIKQVCKALGVTDEMSSPTFSIVNEYATARGEKVYHFDFYRIKNETEASEIGTEEYFYSGYPCLVEWPDKIPSLIPPQFASVKISIENETQRTIAISVHDGKEENRI